MTRIGRGAGLLVLVAVLLAATAAPGVARPPPEPACWLCGDVAWAAGDGGDLSVERSTAVVNVAPNGSAVWTVRNRIGRADAEALRTASGSLDAAFRDEREGYALVDGSPRIRDDTLVVRYRDPDFAARTVGAVRVDHLYDSAAGGIGSLGADRLTVVGPDGTRVGRSFSGARVDGNRIVLEEWTAGSAEFATFVPADGSAMEGQIRTWAAIGAGVGRTLAVNLLFGLLVPAAVLVAALTAGSATVGRIGGHRFSIRQRGAALAGVGVLLVAVAFLPGGNVGSRRLLVTFGVGITTLGAGVVRSKGRPSVARWLGAGVAAVVLAIAAASLVSPTASAVDTGLGVGTLFLLPAVGRARTTRERRVAVGAALAVFTLAAATVYSFASPASSGLSVVYLSVYAVVLAVGGLPFALIGLPSGASSEP